MKARLIIVGGFLGAGKTTLLWESLRKLSAQGRKTGLITNDQAAELVDTAFLEYANGVVEEVNGSCFCCNFKGFSEAIAEIAGKEACELIIAEPVGSCTDLSATILQPLKEKFNDSLFIAPLTVLVDPDRLAAILEGGNAGLHESAAYILRKQLEEADIILISKSDLPDPDKIEILKQKAAVRWPLAKVFAASSKTGDGLDRWLEEVLSSTEAGTHLADVDYDVYAEGEAVLGWYNGSFQLKGKEADWGALLNRLAQLFAEEFEKSEASVGHLKMLIQNGHQYLMANMTGKNNEITMKGSLTKAEDVKLTVNARVQMSPEELESVINGSMALVCQDGISCATIASRCLSPGRPNPTYRYSHIV